VLTKVLSRVAPTFPALVNVTLWAVLEGFVTVSYVVEEMNLVFLGEKRSSNAVDGCISPALIVESTLLIEEVEEFGVPFAPP
jgi:hypothetical protein